MKTISFSTEQRPFPAHLQSGLGANPLYLLIDRFKVWALVYPPLSFDFMDYFFQRALVLLPIIIVPIEVTRFNSWQFGSDDAPITTVTAWKKMGSFPLTIYEVVKLFCTLHGDNHDIVGLNRVAHHGSTCQNHCSEEKNGVVINVRFTATAGRHAGGTAMTLKDGLIRRTYVLNGDVLHRIDSIAITHSCRKSEVIETLVRLFFDPSPQFSDRVRGRFKEALDEVKAERRG